jgi:EAL domain-containing protein (putative c-di-GMP-specific phosphodiesterase class I)/CheY-like chemotaxis protein
MRQKRLAIIDDEPGFSEFVLQVAESCGLQGFATADPAAFRDHLRAHRPDIIVLDLYMPGTDGVELLREIGQLSAASMVFLASGTDTRVLDSAFRLGKERGLRMVGAIRKPIRAVELRALLGDLLTGRNSLKPGELAQALELNQLDLRYQPTMDIRKRAIVGVEALARWEHPTLGTVLPGEFIPMAEESGLIEPLTRWVFARGVAECGHLWQSGHQLRLSLNLSAHNLDDLTLPDWTMELCTRLGVPASAVTIELTESATMQDTVKSMDILTRFRLKGFQLSIDDFGTGFSSLVQLQRLPFSEMKVDRSFVAAAAHSPESAVIVKTIIDLAHNLSLQAVAEGVEEDSVMQELDRWGCDMAQGFLISRPLTADQLHPYLASWS